MATRVSWLGRVNGSLSFFCKKSGPHCHGSLHLFIYYRVCVWCVCAVIPFILDVVRLANVRAGATRVLTCVAFDC